MYEIRRLLNATVSEDDYQRVTRFAAEDHVSRAAWLRQAIDLYLRIRQEAPLSMPETRSR